MASTPKALPPDVKDALSTAVKSMKSQSAAGKAIGRSAATISQALNDKYIGDIEDLAERIRGQFMNKMVKCPVLEDITSRHCLDYQVRPLVFTNPMRVALHRACKTCPNRKD